MRRGYIIAIMISAVVVAVLVVFYSFEQAAPAYQGKSLRFWLAELSDRSSTRASSIQKAEAALAAMGTNSLPFILDELRMNDRPRLERMVNTISRFLWMRLHYRIDYTPAFVRRTGAKEGLTVLAPSLGIPALTSLLNDRNKEVCDGAAKALSQMHDKSSRESTFGPARALVSALSHTNRYARVATATRLRDCGFWTPEALPPLLKCLEDSDAELRVEAALTFEWYYRAFYREPEWASWTERAAVSSILLHCLQETNSTIRRSAVISLGRTGDGSPEVLAAIKRTLTDKDRTVSETAERALIILHNVSQRRNSRPKDE